MRHLDIGLDLEQILVVTSPNVVPGGVDGRREAEVTLKNEVSQLASVRSATYTGNLPGHGFNFSMLAVPEGALPRRHEKFIIPVLIIHSLTFMD